MARQAGPFYINGCYSNTCFYRIEEKYYARKKSSLEGKRVKKDPAFRETMRYAGWLGRASKMASRFYRTLPVEQKDHDLFRVITGRAMLLLKEGKCEEEVMFILNGIYQQQERLIYRNVLIVEKDCFAEKVLCRVFSSCIHDEERLCVWEGLPP